MGTLINHPAVAKLLTLLGPFVVVAVVVSTAYSLSQLTWQLSMPTPQKPPATGERGPEQLSASDTDRSQAATIAGWNLFGTEEVKEEVESPKVDMINAPQTRMRLKLEGVFVARNPDNSLALIANQGQAANVYTVGSSIPGGATLAGVFADRVVLQRDDAFETLRFPDSDEDIGLQETQTRSTPTSEPRRSSSRRERAEQSAPPQRELTDQDNLVQNIQRMTPESFMYTYAPVMESNPQAILDGAGLTPQSSSNGEPGGYAVGSNAPAELMEQIGLQQGDVIVSVNNHPVGDVQRDRQLVNQIIESGVARIEIRRGSRQFVVTYPLR
ncbi:type II secretion system protein N [Desulfurispira natronophila]|uniref:General secretion pathway protein C n=1 Tax=Desulfurispira natronophila TaxID=682562 RepID=A0A7W7Y3A2_9BACT|nr:type II secretion system protein N [Desulfurispira natronophila]MBB5021233.1 general secretion pathway protein C [Desulfurispira natronophila]